MIKQWEKMNEDDQTMGNFVWFFHLAVGPSAAGKQVKISSPFLKCNRCNDKSDN